MSLDHYLAIVHNLHADHAVDLWAIMFEAGWDKNTSYRRRLVTLINSIAHYGDTCKAQAARFFHVLNYLMTQALDFEISENVALRIIYYHYVKINRFKLFGCGIDWREYRVYDLESFYQIVVKLDKFTFNELHEAIRHIVDTTPDDYNQMVDSMLADDHMLEEIINQLETERDADDDLPYVAPRKRANKCMWGDKTCPRMTGYTCEICDGIVDNDDE